MNTTFAFVALIILISSSLAIKSTNKLRKNKQAPKKTTAEKAPVTNSTNTTETNTTATPANSTATPANSTATPANGTAVANSTDSNTLDTMKNATKSMLDKAKDIFGLKENSTFTKFSYFVMFALSAMML